MRQVCQHESNSGTTCGLQFEYHCLKVKVTNNKPPVTPESTPPSPPVL